MTEHEENMLERYKALWQGGDERTPEENAEMDEIERCGMNAAYSKAFHDTLADFIKKAQT